MKRGSREKPWEGEQGQLGACLQGLALGDCDPGECGICCWRRRYSGRRAGPGRGAGALGPSAAAVGPLDGLGPHLCPLPAGQQREEVVSPPEDPASHGSIVLSLRYCNPDFQHLWT